ncbi:MAG: riboflavin synthase [Sumerlaeia bacterium]
MFTGLIEDLGRLRSIRPRASGVELVIESALVARAAKPGDSIAVEGVCLTAETLHDDTFSAFASPETIDRSALSDRQPGDLLNLERSMTLGGRLDGHMVQGHVDATGWLRSVTALGDAWEAEIEAPETILRQCVEKGSIAVNGISLTIASLRANSFTLAIIPETWTRTTLSRRDLGARVNLETDVIGKYVFRFLETQFSIQGTNPALSPGRLDDIWRAFRS